MQTIIQEDNIMGTSFGHNDSGSGPAKSAEQQSMELLYIWINCDESEFIQEQGFNLSPKYQFELSQDIYNHYILSCIMVQHYPNVWKSERIVNLTAVVGENGSGKSVLLRHLANASILPIEQKDNQTLNTRADNDHNISEEELPTDFMEYGKMVLVYQVGNSIRIIHNLSKNSFVNNTPFADVLTVDDNLADIEILLSRQTKIYISNTFSTVNTIWEDRAPHQPVIFSPAGNRKRADAFFKKTSGLNLVSNIYAPDGNIHRFERDPGFINHTLAPFYYLQYRIVSNKPHRDFERLAAIRCYQCTDKENLSDTRMASRNKDLIVSAESFFSMIKDPSDNLPAFFDKQFGRALYKIRTDYSAYRSDNLGNKSVDRVLSKYYKLEQWFFNYAEYNTTEIDSISKYYNDAKKQIAELADILSNCPEEPHRKGIKWPTSKRVRILHDSDAYGKFCDFIDRQMKQPYSFVLKYLYIQMAPQSSGEQALQNIFSWLRLLPDFNEILGEESVRIQKNLLLLLDEVDLYMHPEWQRRFLYELSERLKTEYPDKHIQVVISTHSPLVLSDIPSCNTIYLDKNDDQCTLAERTDNLESFGANLFSLLKDSFFLKKSIGAFAYSKISEIVDHLEMLKTLNALDETIAQKHKNEQNTRIELRQRKKLMQELIKNHKFKDAQAFRDACWDYRKVIDIIGEPMIRGKLQTMHEALFPKDPDDDELTPEKLRRLLENGDDEKKKRYLRILRAILENENAD